MSCRKLLPVFVLSLSLFLTFPLLALAQDGEALYKQNCTSCHSIGKGTVIGPDLKDVGKRQSKEWLTKWIMSSTTMIKSGDSYANEIFNKFNKTSMPDQSLSEAQIGDVLAYIEKKSAEAPAVAATATAAHGAEEGASNEFNQGTWLLTAVLLFAMLYVLSTVRARLEKVIRSKDAQPEPAKLPWRSWARENKKLIALVLIVLFVGGSGKAWYALKEIGVNTGYQPDQPIAFSHEVHAGNLQIACIYCHSGAEKSKTAGVPSANVCMNCHKFIKEGKTTGTKEIAKIYKALDYNPETQQYGTNPEPLQWVRVHNLPDLAYFNHSQHVKVGGVDCAKCHGDMTKKTVAHQESPLTMAWCIECHQQTPVKKEGNHYYDNYHAIHFNRDSKADTILTVEKMGGTECAKCHY